MRLTGSLLASCAVCACCLTAGCANPPSSAASAASADEGVYVTGSNIKRRDYRSGSDHVVSGAPDASTSVTGGQVR